MLERKIPASPSPVDLWQEKFKLPDGVSDLVCISLLRLITQQDPHFRQTIGWNEVYQTSRAKTRNEMKWEIASNRQQEPNQELVDEEDVCRWALFIALPTI